MLQRSGLSRGTSADSGAVPKNGAQTSAEHAALTYVSDAEPGIRRLKAGKGFYYKGPDGRPVSNAARARIEAIVIPPAWTDVWISPDANGHIQATGRDQRGRKQYRYHPQWAEERDSAKYSSLVAFAESLPELRRTIDSDLRRHGLPFERVVAAIVWLLDNTMIRVGNAAYARDNKSFGLTTLRDRHVDIKGSSLRFAFKGKSGKEWKLKLVDRRIAGIVRGAQDLPGQKLFQYLDEEGNRRPVRSDDVNRYIRGAAGDAFSSKHFRTWGGTIHAASLFAQTELPESQAQQKRVMNSVIDKVAERLGNTRAVCRKCYIHPRVFEAWSQGRLLAEMAEANRRKRSIDGLDEEEALVLRWLRAHEG
ncbi:MULTISPECIES: DNA topoisomerase IB [Mesorhizobium]|uniref:DNA topoisomerase IB n=1 Tax=Mesorhizobium TaxID=68287 RepID=UPI0003CF3677|nr:MULTISPECIES: DNA topoisomerase IB [Mesorhizobium]ESY67426.1 DNA topoisomerase [Mesorhizobium sp. LNHC232B00]WJI36249.1 DNA topoisomerase IB [Mesorhizobium opportunistum]